MGRYSTLAVGKNFGARPVGVAIEGFFVSSMEKTVQGSGRIGFNVVPLLRW